VIVPPWLVFLLLVSLTLALLYQAATRRFGWRIVVYWLLVFAAAAAAEAGAESVGLDVTRFGDLRLLPDLGGAVAVLGSLWFLGL
jgi:hypothetical protein